MLNVTQILAQYGDNYRKGLLNPGDLVAPLLDYTEWDSLFTTVETDSTIVDSVAWTMNNARFQKWQKQFLPLGGMSFTPNTIQLYHLMRDTEITPAEIEGTALDFLASQGLTAFTAPILNIYLQWYTKQSLNAFHQNETYKAVNAPVTPGTASAEGALFQGVKEQIRLAKLTGAGVPKPITLLANEAVPTDPVEYVKYLHKLYDAVPPELKNFIKAIVCDQDKILLYKEGIRLMYQSYWNQLGQNPSFNTAKRVGMVNRDCELVGTFDMKGSDQHWMTVQGNAIKGVKKGSNLMAWNADQYVGGRTIWASNDVWIGYGFRHWHLVLENGKS